MSAYASDTKRAKTVCAELRALRLEMKYSLAEMAQLLGIAKATYQGYESGRRAMPAGFINRVREWQQIDLDFAAGTNGRVDARLAAEGFGNGIPSDIAGEEFDI